ncbi:MAG: discoidin domain-containing protein [Clostridia bacterium]
MKRIVILALVITMAFSLCVNAEEGAEIEETTVSETETRENLALNKDVEATDEEDDKGNIAPNLTDGNEVSYWASNVKGSSAKVDLGEVYYIDTIEFIPHDGRNYGYKMSVSIDGINYVSIVEGSNSERAAVVTEEFTMVEARYVMLTITSIPSGTSWINIKELRVYGEKYGTPLYCGEEGQGLSIDVDGTKLTGTFTGTSRAAWGRKMTLIVAVFDENKMIAYNAETNTIPEYGTEFTKSISLTIDDSSIDMTGKRVEIFVWDDFENMKTLVSPVGITIEATE